MALSGARRSIFQKSVSPPQVARDARDDDALESLAKLRRLPATDSRVVTEWRGILAEIQFQKVMVQKGSPGQARVCVGAVASRVSTRQFFIYYAPTLFTLLGQAVLSLILAGTQNIGQLIAVIAAFLIVDATGRRTLAIWGAFAMGVPYVVIAALYGLYSDAWPARPAAGWACIAMGICIHRRQRHLVLASGLDAAKRSLLDGAAVQGRSPRDGDRVAVEVYCRSCNAADDLAGGVEHLRDKRKQRTEIPIDIAQEALSSDMHNGTLGSMMSAAGLDASPLPSQRRSAPDNPCPGPIDFCKPRSHGRVPRRKPGKPGGWDIRMRDHRPEPEREPEGRGIALREM
ncbi:hypothetical protein D0864_12346 [Hortaea werneckii]|uniref:Major facilitator superfamily (MFS) profile domain-containing protein n=1 Tax=Hortaea werneckii TaxID=91943 RepID=A0A3M7DK85_HORWE|nr:hypothetical protein D0864_12346 [Hortaea werneckii]